MPPERHKQVIINHRLKVLMKYHQFQLFAEFRSSLCGLFPHFCCKLVFINEAVLIPGSKIYLYFYYICFYL
jgi:hypothetical protein